MRSKPGPATALPGAFFGSPGWAVWPLWVLAAAVLVLVAIRAIVQSITIDEADTYVYWVSGKIHTPWYPHSNNHLLNTYLIWVFVHLFGLSNITMRLPAFIGALLYLTATYRFCLAFVPALWLRIPLYACFIINPLVLDFFVAARGYGLALGFFTTAIVTMCQILQAERGRWPLVARLAAISVCLALSFTANFSFAFVIGVSTVLFGLFWLTTRSVRPAESAATLPNDFRFYLQSTLALLIPGAVTMAALAGWTLLHWPKGQLVVGATSIAEMWNTFLEFTFSDLNGHILPAFLLKTFRHWRKALPWILVVLCLLQIAGIAILHGKWRSRLPAQRAAVTGIYLGATVMLTVLAHWLAFRYAGLLLPKDRTSLFFLPLCLMIVAITASFPDLGFFGTAMRWPTVAVLIVGSCFFVGCLRLHYFLQWRFDADIAETYQKLVQTVGSSHQLAIPSCFLCSSALNYYREYFNDNSFVPFGLYDSPKLAPDTHYLPYPLNDPVYVLIFPRDEEFAAERRLSVVYRGQLSDVVIALKTSGAAKQARPVEKGTQSVAAASVGGSIGSLSR